MGSLHEWWRRRQCRRAKLRLERTRLNLEKAQAKLEASRRKMVEARDWPWDWKVRVTLNLRICEENYCKDAQAHYVANIRYNLLMQKKRLEEAGRARRNSADDTTSTKQ